MPSLSHLLHTPYQLPTNAMRSIQHRLLSATLTLMITTSMTFQRIKAFASLTRHPSSFVQTITMPPSFLHHNNAINRHRSTMHPSQTRYYATSNNKPNENITNRALHLNIPTPADMEEIASLLSVRTSAGDTIFLDGDLGAGKTCFSRGFIRSRSGYAGRITSPTYLLCNTYDAGDDEVIYHLDLYRLNTTDEEHRQQLIPLDLENVFHKGIALVEWPERLNNAGSFPMSRLEITLTIDLSLDDASTTSPAANNGDTANNDEDEDDTRNRIMRLIPYGERWMERLQFYESQGYFDDLIIRQ